MEYVDSIPPVTISERPAPTIIIEHIFNNRDASLKGVRERNVVALAHTCLLDENRVKHRG